LRGGIFLGHQFTLFDRLTSQLDGFIYKHENYDWNIWPSLSIGYKITSYSKLYGSISKSYRAPTFTDLYYISPANIGNPELVPEQALCYEIGYSVYSKFIDGGISVFRREGENLIDWVRQSPDDPWQVQNVSDINTSGLEISAVSHPDLIISSIPIHTISASYTILDADRDCNGFESKYALDLLEHQFLVSIVHAMPFNMSQVWKFRYEVPSEDDSRMITDTKLIMQFEKLEWYLEASNLFDYTYSDIGSIPMPGRQVITGISYRVF
jgi:iron complex outermembrane receptor protein